MAINFGELLHSTTADGRLVDASQLWDGKWPSLGAFQDVINASLGLKIKNADSSISELKTYIDSKVSNVYVYKGSVDTHADLVAIGADWYTTNYVSPTIGDVWNVVNDTDTGGSGTMGMNYACKSRGTKSTTTIVNSSTSSNITVSGDGEAGFNLTFIVTLDKIATNTKIELTVGWQPDSGSVILHSIVDSDGNFEGNFEGTVSDSYKNTNEFSATYGTNLESGAGQYTISISEFSFSSSTVEKVTYIISSVSNTLPIWDTLGGIGTGGDVSAAIKKLIDSSLVAIDSSIKIIDSSIKTLDTSVNIIDNSISIINSSFGNIFGGNIDTVKGYVENYVAGKISGVYTYKGSVATHKELLELSNKWFELSNGDVYNVIDDSINGGSGTMGMNYAYLVTVNLINSSNTLSQTTWTGSIDGGESATYNSAINLGYTTKLSEGTNIQIYFPKINKTYYDSFFLNGVVDSRGECEDIFTDDQKGAYKSAYPYKLVYDTTLSPPQYVLVFTASVGESQTTDLIPHMPDSTSSTKMTYSMDSMTPSWDALGGTGGGIGGGITREQLDASLIPIDNSINDLSTGLDTFMSYFINRTGIISVGSTIAETGTSFKVDASAYKYCASVSNRIPSYNGALYMDNTLFSNGTTSSDANKIVWTCSSTYILTTGSHTFSMKLFDSASDTTGSVAISKTVTSIPLTYYGPSSVIDISANNYATELKSVLKTSITNGSYDFSSKASSATLSRYCNFWVVVPTSSASTYNGYQGSANVWNISHNDASYFTVTVNGGSVTYYVYKSNSLQTSSERGSYTAITFQA